MLKRNRWMICMVALIFIIGACVALDSKEYMTMNNDGSFANPINSCEQSSPEFFATLTIGFTDFTEGSKSEIFRRFDSPTKLPPSVSLENHPIPALILRSGIDHEGESNENALHPEFFTIDIKYYVISMMDNEDRIQNIKTQKSKIASDINIFEAINGDNVDMNNVEHQIVADEFKQDNTRRKREIGCYLSHYYILKLIEQSGNPDGYTVIFEDDFDIISDDFESQLKIILGNMSHRDFDILYIDMISKNNNGGPVVAGVCNLTPENNMYGTQAYMVKNKSVKKLLSETWNINMPIDNKYDAAIRSNKLTAYACCPFLTNSINVDSTIS